MSQDLFIGIASILVAGVGAQWLAWRFKLPSIVLLLAIGFIAGPVMLLIRPDEVLGPLLMPLVSISVAIILFEGGLGLRLHELSKIGKAVFNLVSVGVLINGVLITLAAHYILGLNLTIAMLLGSILVVTGPTVIIPLLRHVRPTGKVGSVIKWEGIVIDPVGAALAVFVYEYIVVGEIFSVGALIFFIKSILIGSALGFAGAWMLILALRKYWIPDFLHGTVTLILVVAIFTLSNIIHHESGLFAVIAMGIAMGNQRKVEVQQIVSFKENLGILIISTLFIILAARLNLKDLAILDWRFIAFLAVLVLIARPLSVFISTIKSGLSTREKLFISWMAPRGIVAAAIVSIFAFRLAEKGIPQAEYLVPVTFLVIIGTVLIYGTTSLWVATKLGLAQSHPQGVLILGAHSWARKFAKCLRDVGIKVILIDSNAINIALAREDNLEAYEENIFNQDIEENIDFSGIGRLMTLTANDEANSLAVLHFRDIFGRSEVYQLFPGRKIQSQDMVIPPSLRGRYIFNRASGHDVLVEQFRRKDAFKTIVVTEDLNEESFSRRYGKGINVLFSVNEKKVLKIFTVDEKFQVKKGDTVFALSDGNSGDDPQNSSN
ncbi:MAG: sodium:proton antiporter [Candidatus Omnitrophica bacterium]|nr:sodium:proton antiporter [Candidatus Omnitrophota bacterium]